MDIDVLLFAKKDNLYCDYAEKILASYYSQDQYLSVRGTVGDRLDEDLHWHKPKYIVSFLSPWILPAGLLSSAQIAAVNFHPGSPDYPGTGCYNFALYEKPGLYGVTCHHMKPRVDTGDIISTSYFPIAPLESVETLKLKSMYHLLFLFDSLLSTLCKGLPLPVSAETWRRKPFTKKQMLALFEIDPTLHSQEEIDNRIRAAAYPSCKGAYVRAGTAKFYHEVDPRKPIV